MKHKAKWHQSASFSWFEKKWKNMGLNEEEINGYNNIRTASSQVCEMRTGKTDKDKALVIKS